MAKKSPQRRAKQTQETNWVVVGGLALIGILILGGLLYLTLRPSQMENVLTLAAYCAENSDRCAATGDLAAPVTMVEVSDFGCPHCTDFHAETAGPLMEQYVDSGTMRWVALPYALGPSTVPAAAAAMCANEQDMYFEYASALFAVDPVETRLSPDGFRQAAEATGLDIDAFNSCVADGRYTDIVNSNRDAARNVQVTGTPTFFLNDEKLSGAEPLAVFARTIDSLLSAQ